MPQAKAQAGADVAPPAKTPTFTLLGPDGRNQVLRIPTTHEEMMALVAQRDELKDQLEEVTDRRNEIIGQLRSHPPEIAQESLQSELKVLDQRVAQIHNDLALVGREIARASPELIAMAQEPSGPPPGPFGPFGSGPPGADFAKGLLAGGGTVFVFMAALLLVLRRGWKNARRPTGPALPAGDSDRLQRVENGMEAMAIEIERISEGQRYVTKLLSESPRTGANIS